MWIRPIAYAHSRCSLYALGTTTFVLYFSPEHHPVHNLTKKYLHHSKQYTYFVDMKKINTYLSEDDQKRFRSLDSEQRLRIAKSPLVNVVESYVHRAFKGKNPINSPAMQEAVRLANEILDQTTTP